MKPKQTAGFALIASLSIMAVLVMIAVALYSLSSVATRTAKMAAAKTEAQANAKMALMLAIGELQSELGPDQRISANAAIRDSSPEDASIDGVAHPHWLGVWDSWVAGDLANARVNPDYPSGTSHHQTIGDPNDAALSDEMHPQYDQKNNHFRRWLVSLNLADADPENPDLPLNELPQLDGDPIPGKDSTAVHLVGANSLGSSPDDTDFVTAQLLDIKNRGTSISGRYAWWVGDQSQKATIKADTYETEDSLSDADRLFRIQAPAAMGTKLISALSGITPKEEAQFDKVGASLKQLDLIRVGGSEVSGSPSKTFTLSDESEINYSFHHLTMDSYGVLADVREGGLKRDLSTLLARPIDRNESGDEFMLYAFDDPRFNSSDSLFDNYSGSRVPIQDLAAYYQLYDDEPGFANERREGVRYDSTELNNSIQLNVPDYDGDAKDRDYILREYSALYRQPVLTKVQFLVGLTAQKIEFEDRQDIQNQIDGGPKPPFTGAPAGPVPESATHRLRVGINPVVTLWNPNNVPLVMEKAQRIRVSNAPPLILKWKKYMASEDDYESGWFNLSFLASGGKAAGYAGGFTFLELRLNDNGSDAPLPIVFEPGEVKVFSLPAKTGATLNSDGDTVVLQTEDGFLDASGGWDPYGFFLMQHSAPFINNSFPNVFHFWKVAQPGSNLVFKEKDSFSFFVDTDEYKSHWASTVTVAEKGQISGAAFTVSMMDEGFREKLADKLQFLQHYALISRHGGRDNTSLSEGLAIFNEELLTPAFPEGKTPIDYDTANPITGSQLIGASENGEVVGMLEFSLNLGCEAGPLSTGGFGGGRRIASRPFLHSGAGAAPFIDQSDKASLYNFGWNWYVDKFNNVEDSTMQVVPGTDNTYYGGGYTAEAGTARVIQREIPVVPPISIASLSNAQLGGFSLAYASVLGDNPATDQIGHKNSRMDSPEGLDYQRTTATGQGGLAPHVMQAIGNSYAHPNIPAENAFTVVERQFDVDETDEGKIKDIPFADHSYLANKAIWDDYFFSSIAPQPEKIPLFDGPDRTAKNVADDFFFNDIPLPNRRIKPYKVDFGQAQLDNLFAEANDYSEGLADKIAARLMVDGSFNINSTSVEAWKVLLTSLKGKTVSYFDGGVSPKQVLTSGTPLGSGILPNAEPIESVDINGSNQPVEQWQTGRELTDDEINQLAKAIVKQVKQRGPFLSLSEFINRRLDGDNTELSLKGALQAAIDDGDVTINESFRQPARTLDSETSDISGFKFSEAADGPIAYGSMAYLDQADVLKHFSEQLTPRGDTFVIRTYGDSLDAGGNVIARVWCEAVVQRVPEYSDPSDDPHEKQAELSETNKNFGRKFKIVSFRWLDSKEV